MQLACVERLEGRQLLAAIDVDPTFGKGGKVSTDLFGGDDFVSAVAVQADGKIVVAGRAKAPGQTYEHFALVRYNADGSLDDGSAKDSTPGDHFGNGGKVLTPLGSHRSDLTSIAIQTDGKIIAVGNGVVQGVPGGKGFVCRYNVNGTLDTQFGGGDGIAILDLGPFTDVSLNAVAMQGSKIIVAGSAATSNQQGWLFARFKSDGAIDESFTGLGTTGWNIQTWNGFSLAYDMTILPTGEILAAGLASGNKIGLERMGAGGNDFGSQTTYAPFAPIIYPTEGLAVRPNGRAVVVGNSGGGFKVEFEGTTSATRWYRKGPVSLNDVLVDVRGHAIAGGTGRYNAALQPSSDSNFFLGDLDTLQVSFVDIGNHSFDSGVAVAVAPDGSIVQAGTTYVSGEDLDVAVVRYKGTPKNSYGSVSGIVFNDINGNGVQDAGDIGLSELRVYVDLDQDGVFDQGSSGTLGEPDVITDSTGKYTIDGLAPGTYTIRSVVPAGRTQTFPANGSHTINIAAEQKVTHRNFGVAPFVRGKISGVVYDDEDLNETYSSSYEKTLPGWTVYLDINNNGSLDAGEKSSITDDAGRFEFGDLDYGSYRLRIKPQSGYRMLAGSEGRPVQLSSGNPTATREFGVTSKIGLSGKVTDERNDTPKFGVVVNVVSNNTIVATTTTNPSGLWAVTSLPAGTGRVEIVAPSGYTVVSPANGKYMGSATASQQIANLNFVLRAIPSNPTATAVPSAPLFAAARLDSLVDDLLTDEAVC